MDIEDVAETMRSRMPWDTARRVFDSGEIQKAHGWDNTLRKLVENSADDDAVIEHLSAALKEHILCGEKLTRFYRVPTRELAEIRDAVMSLRPRPSAFREMYPAAISSDAIDDPFPREPTLVAVETNEDGVGVVFASTRAVHIRQPIDVSALPEDAAELLEDFDEVLGIKLKKFQAMDVVWIPHRGSFIDVRVDFPRGMHRDTAGAINEDIKRRFSRAVEAEHLASPVNLFPIIRRIYDTPDEGNIVELAFGTTTASLKHEKMRRGSLDLRKERYHRGGKSALNAPIEPHRVSVRWEVPVGETTSSPELSLNGGLRTASSSSPALFDAIIQGCVGVSDYEFVRERIEHYLRNR